MKTALIACATALLFTASPIWANPEEEATPWAIGEVFSEDGETLLYREYLYADHASLDHPTRVHYKTPEGELFAEKSLEYRDPAAAPMIEFEDHRLSTRLRTQMPEGNARRMQVAFQANESSRMRETELRLDESLIIDAGFDVYIRQNWEELTENRRLVADFLVPSRMNTVRVGLTETDTGDCRARHEDIYCFEVRPAGILRVASWFVDPIRVAYERDTRRLIMFDGPGNIPDEEGENRNVLIHYTYQATDAD